MLLDYPNTLAVSKLLCHARYPMSCHVCFPAEKGMPLMVDEGGKQTGPGVGYFGMGFAVIGMSVMVPQP